MVRISKRMLAVVMFLALAMSAGFSARAEAAQKTGSSVSNQDKAKACENMADKKGLKGNDRKSFMQDCLGKATGTQPVSDMSEKEKRDACRNMADKKNLKGQDRSSFMKDCMNKANSK